MSLGAHWGLSVEQAKEIHSGFGTAISVCVSYDGKFWGGEAVGINNYTLPSYHLSLEQRNCHEHWGAIQDAIKNDALGKPIKGVNPYAKREVKMDGFKGTAWELNEDQAKRFDPGANKLYVLLSADGKMRRLGYDKSMSLNDYILDRYISWTDMSEKGYKPRWEAVRQAILNDDLGEPTIGTNPYAKEKVEMEEPTPEGAVWKLTGKQAERFDSDWRFLLIGVAKDGQHWRASSASYYSAKESFELLGDSSSRMDVEHNQSNFEAIRQAILNDTLGEPIIGVNPYKKESGVMKEETKDAVLSSLSRGMKLGAVDSAGSAIMEMMTSIMGVDHPLVTDPANAEYVKAVGALILTAASSEFDLPKGELISTISQLQLEMSTAKIVSANMEPIINAVKVIGVRCSELLPEFKAKE